jgi:hypothetical protein
MKCSHIFIGTIVPIVTGLLIARITSANIVNSSENAQYTRSLSALEMSRTVGRTSTPTKPADGTGYYCPTVSTVCIKPQYSLTCGIGTVSTGNTIPCSPSTTGSYYWTRSYQPHPQCEGAGLFGLEDTCHNSLTYGPPTNFCYRDYYYSTGSCIEGGYDLICSQTTQAWICGI